MIKECYDIGGMHCAACSGAVERVTRRLPGVRSSVVNLVTGRMTIEYDETKTTPEMIVEKVEKAGFSATRSGTETPHEGETQGVGRLIAMLCLAGGDLVLSVCMMLGVQIPLIWLALLGFLLTTPVLVLGRHFFVGGCRALVSRAPNMDSLVALSAGASWLYSVIVAVGVMMGLMPEQPLYFESAAMVVALVSLGKHLEARSTHKTKEAVRKLRALAPDKALRVEGGAVCEVRTSEIGVGDIVLVRTGMSAPVDGIVTEGSGHVNEAMLTGECLPVQKKVGDVVIAGSVVSDGALYVRAEKVGGDTMFSRIVQYVEDAQSEKAPIARLADRVAGVFVPAVICIALLAGIIWLCCGQTLAFALNIFTSVLVIACPCAMGLATPTAIIVGTGLGATHGILIRSAAALEMTHAIRTVVFDKTGTLTEGMPAVTDVIPAEGMGCAHVVSLAAGLEISMSHPLAGAVCRYAEVHQFELPQVHAYRDVPGMGVSGTTAEGASILVGSVALMADSQVDISLMQREIERLSDEAKTVVCVAENGRLIGILGIADALRSDAAEAVHALQTMGIRTVMITGDASRVASVIARQAGLDDFRAGVLPTQKADMICAFQKDGDRVMMVGDGINDAPALARADIGCAVGSGSDIAVDSAQIILLGNHLVDVPRAIRLSRQTMKKIKQNLFWAFCYNSLGIPVAAGVFYPAFGWLLVPMVCAAAMCLSSLFVVTNALSLRKYKL